MSLNPNQFKLFYSADELQRSLTDSGDRNRPTNPNGVGFTGQKESMQDMWSRKLAQSQASPATGEHGSGVYNSIAGEGFRPHAKLLVNHDNRGGASLNDGHHRLAAAADIERTTGKPQWINAEHTAPGMERRDPHLGPIRKVAAPVNARYSVGEDLLAKLTQALG